MDIEIIKKTNEPLMKRHYFEAKVVFSGKTPSRPELIKDLDKKLSAKEGLTSIRLINTDYGSERAIITGYTYDDEAVMKKIENKFTQIRHLSKADQKAEKEKMKAAKQAKAAAKKAKK